ncbi:MAG: peptide deformylase [Prevotella sp.]|jgi:peptide deformylase|nr:MULTISPECIES: peptide deformylase [unclassified Prevotella]MCH3969099.1 peptide deformylase [Prevotella sp.]MCH3992053.1 peptide deformylase [Prevotella sp.]MCH4099656.1 peptide deformylase [Prevotella sp.]MCH4186284.1 peptide deformylase [Prevotella sp.]MCH4216095.1 peptide deformylase [Prevotella sp.]
MILPIYVYGQPVLRKVAKDITPDYEGLKELIPDMFETLTASNGVGLAAPQIGKSIRVVVIDLNVLSDELPEYKDFRKAYINGHILGSDDKAGKASMEEGCLSIPGVNESVSRPKKVHVSYLDEDFHPHDEWVSGYLACVMQHEFDHLEGVLFVDKINPLRKNLIGGRLKNILKGKFRCSYRTRVFRK